MQHRNATLAEVVKAVRVGQKMSFRHFIKEIYAPRSRNGVRHQERSISTILMVDGVPSVKHHGRIEPLTGSIATMDDGKEIFYDLRIKSEYLK